MQVSPNSSQPEHVTRRRFWLALRPGNLRSILSMVAPGPVMALAGNLQLLLRSSMRTGPTPRWQVSSLATPGATPKLTSVKGWKYTQSEIMVSPFPPEMIRSLPRILMPATRGAGLDLGSARAHLISSWRAWVNLLE